MGENFYTRPTIFHDRCFMTDPTPTAPASIPESPSPDSPEKGPQSQTIEALALDRIERHLFLCADQTKPKCCDKAASLESWNYLKRRLKELSLDKPNGDRPTCVFRTKANCLRVCEAGPILLVYPDGVWYHSATPDVIERILQEHVLGNRIVTEYAFVQQPLPTEAAPVKRIDPTETALDPAETPQVESERSADTTT